MPVSLLATIQCEVCDEPHWADVELIEKELKGVCRRSGEAFAISGLSSPYRVDGDAFSASLAQTLDLEGSPRRVRGLQSVWSLGILRFNHIRIALFSTPSLSRVDLATTILDSVAGQSRCTAHCLLVADEIDAVQLLRRNGAVVRLRDVATIASEGTLTIDSAEILAATFPDISLPRRSGRPANQRERIFQLLDESGNSGTIEASNWSLRELGRKFESRFTTKSPAPSTIREAIRIWNSRHGFGSSSD